MPSVAHLYALDGSTSNSVTANRSLDPPSEATAATLTAAYGAGTGGDVIRSSITEGHEEEEEGKDEDEGKGQTSKAPHEGDDGVKAAQRAAAKLLEATAKQRHPTMSMGTVVLQEAKRNKRFKFFSEER